MLFAPCRYIGWALTLHPTCCPTGTLLQRQIQKVTIIVLVLPFKIDSLEVIYAHHPVQLVDQDLPCPFVKNRLEERFIQVLLLARPKSQIFFSVAGLIREARLYKH